jgi:hypothetical protein
VTTTFFNARPPGRDPSLGREFIPGLHREPTDADTRMWSEGAKAALRYAADLARKALADGQSPEEVLLRLDNSTALPLTHLRSWGLLPATLAIAAMAVRNHLKWSAA